MLSFYTKINVKWTKDLNMRDKTIQLLEEKIVVHLNDLACGSQWFLRYNTKSTGNKMKNR